MFSANDLRDRLAGLPWRLTLFYTLAVTLLLIVLSVYLEGRLSSFATGQLENRLVARAAALAQPPGPRPPKGQKAPPPRAGLSALTEPFNLGGLANQVARSDPAGVHTTILRPDGFVVQPSDAPSTWRPTPNLSTDLLTRAALTGRAQGPLTVSGPNGKVLVVDQPLGRPRELFAVAQISTPTSDIQDLLASFRLALVIGVVALFVVALAIGLPLARLALSPLRRFAVAIAGISPEHLGERVELPKARDQLRELALTFNHLLERIDASVERERRTQEQLRRFVADASHELRSPLAGLAGYAELLQRGGDLIEPGPIAGRMQREIDRMSRLVHDLLALTRLDAAGPRDLRAEPVDLAQIAEEVVDSMMLRANPRHLSLEASDEPLCVEGNRDALERAIENLVSNAIEHTPRDGHIAVRLAQRGNLASVEVADDGEGIGPEHLGHIFERFYRVDAARSRESGNAGLGLAIVQAIVERHHGAIETDSEPGRGSVFRILLPLLSAA